MENATFEIYWRDINIHAKVATKGWAKAPLKYSEKDAFPRMFLEKEKTRICSTSSNFSQRRAIQQEWNKTVFAYILLFRLSSISYFIPPSSFVHIFFSTQYREFYGEFCTNSCWKLCHCFIIDISATLNKSRSNWKYSIRAPCFYIFASSMVGFFRSWLGNPSPPFERCVWNSSRVCVHPPRRFAETLSPMFIFPFFPPPPRIVSKLLDRRIRTFILPLSGIRATPSPLCVRDMAAPIVRQFATSSNVVSIVISL